MSSSATFPEPPFAAEGGLPAPSPSDGDPYQVLDELMAVVEALCPVWPRRDRLVVADRMLL